MKKILSTLLLSCSLAAAQNPQPQTNWAAQMNYSAPSLWLNFNDPTTAFKDRVSQNNFVGTGSITSPTSTIGSIPAITSTTGNPRIYMMTTSAAQAGFVNTISVQFEVAPTAGATYQILVATNNGSGSYTITAEPTTITVAATTTLQTFTTGVGFTPFTIAAGQTVGIVIATGATGLGFQATTGNYCSLSTGTIPAIGTPTTYTCGAADAIAFRATVNTTTVYNSGPITVQQAGFDNTNSSNYSAAFSYSAWSAAPNNTMGAVDWMTPWEMLIHIDRLNWDRIGTVVLASKGDIGNSAGSWWKLYLQAASGGSQLCFVRNSSGLAANPGGSTTVNGGLCTGTSADPMPNGFNYDIVVADNGGGASGCYATSSIGLYVNGIPVGFLMPGSYTPIPATSICGSFQIGFGYASLTVVGGTGYANSTAFTSTGGGANCVVSGAMSATSGVPSNFGFTENYGCTSNPTIVLTTPTGTGVTITAVPSGTSMNSTGYPLIAPGYVSGGTYFGVGGTDATQSPTYVDEFGMWSGNLSSIGIQNLVYQTKFYQNLLKTAPVNFPLAVWNDDGCDDRDNLFGAAAVIAGHRLNYIDVVAFVNDTTNGTPTGVDTALYRQMLDQGGFADAQVGIPSVLVNSGSGCLLANITSFNASTPVSNSSYPSAAAVYRSLLARYPTRPVYFLVGGSARGIVDLMQSGADSISPLTGEQLLAQDASNGGAIYAEWGGGVPPTTSLWNNSALDGVAAQYMVANNGPLHIYWMMGDPQWSGPNSLSTRTSKDPFYLESSFVGTDYSDAFDSLEIAPLLSNYFSGSVNIAIGGSGTGYASHTYFTSTGGGSACIVTGIMVSTSGVPSSIIPIDGGSGASGLGYGCLNAASPPTITLTSPTGTGATLTATTTASACGTTVITNPSTNPVVGSSGFTSCTNEYWIPFSMWATQGNAPIFQWFLNSLIAPPANGQPRMVLQ